MAKFFFVDFKLIIPRINPIIPTKGEILKKIKVTSGPNSLIGIILLKNSINKIKLMLMIPETKATIALFFGSDLVL